MKEMIPELSVIPVFDGGEIPESSAYLSFIYFMRFLNSAIAASGMTFLVCLPF